jgi:gliding motility-associated-like protein
LPQSGIAFFILSIGSNSGDQGIGLNNGYTNGTDGYKGGGYIDVAENAFCQKGSFPNVSLWYHVVVIRNTDSYSVYIDGDFVCTTTKITKQPFYGNGSITATIGSRWNIQQFSNCSIDDINLYNRPLIAEEVKELYEGKPAQTINISASNLAPCGGEKITFTANGATNSSKYQWKIDGVNQGTNSKNFIYNSTNESVDYQVKVEVEVSDEDICFPQKPIIQTQNLTIKNCFTPSNNVDLKKGLVACYPFSGNAKDFSGNGNDGIINGAKLTSDRFGNANSAYNFDGIKDFIRVFNSPSLKFEQISIAMWIKATDFKSFTNSAGTWPRYGGPISRDTRPSSIWSGFSTSTSHGLLRFSVAMEENTSSQKGIENEVDLNVWDFIVFMIENGVEKIYRNGTLVVTEQLNLGKKMHVNNEPINIGKSYWLPSQTGLEAFFTGEIDDIHLYNRPLNKEEIQALYKDVSSNLPTITSSNNNPCMGEKLLFTVNGSTSNAKFEWKIDGAITGPNKKELYFNSPIKTTPYSTKVDLGISDFDPCFPQKPVFLTQNINFKICNSSLSNSKIFIPNVFSPNGDGKNDTWIISNIENFDGVEIEIFNRWGERIFYSEGYKTPWDGYYKNLKLPSGVYLYKIKYDINQTFSGEILILK